MSEPVDNAATVLAMHCGRDSPDTSDYRAAAKAAFNEVDRLRRELAEARNRIAILEAALGEDRLLGIDAALRELKP